MVNEENSIQLSAKSQELAENLAVMNEKGGMIPSAAKIAALLIVCDAGELTFDEIRDTLKLSKSATSNSINMLLNTGKIEYTNKFGERKRYFRSNLFTWEDHLKANFEGLGMMASLLRKIHKNRNKKTVEFNEKLLNVVQFIEYLHEEMPKIYEKWEKDKKS